MVSHEVASFVWIAWPQSSEWRYNIFRRRLERSISKKFYRKYWLSGIPSFWNPSRPPGVNPLRWQEYFFPWLLSHMLRKERILKNWNFEWFERHCIRASCHIYRELEFNTPKARPFLSDLLISLTNRHCLLSQVLVLNRKKSHWTIQALINTSTSLKEQVVCPKLTLK